MVHVYYHIYAIDGVEPIVEEQISLLKKHFDFPYILNVGISLAEENKSIYHLLTKFQNVRDVRANGNEFVTLELIQKDVEKFADTDYILFSADWVGGLSSIAVFLNATSKTLKTAKTERTQYLEGTID